MDPLTAQLIAAEGERITLTASQSSWLLAIPVLLIFLAIEMEWL